MGSDAMTVAQNEKRINRLEKIVVGNGEPGMDEDVRAIRKDVTKQGLEIQEIKTRLGVVESNTKELLTMKREESGYAGVKFDRHSNPGRRESDKSKSDSFPQRVWDRVTENIADKVITAGIIIIVLNFPNFVSKVIELLK